MDKRILAKINKIRGSFTEELVDGFHKRDFEDSVEYIEKQYKHIFESLKKSKGYYFDGLERVCPIEFYKTFSNSSVKQVEVAKNSFYGVKLKHHFSSPITNVREELKDYYFFLPYTNEYGDVYVRNSIYSLKIILSEPGPSVISNKNGKTIFLKVAGFRFKVSKEHFGFNRISRMMGNTVYRSLNINLPASRLYSAKNNSASKANKIAKPLLAWYVFGKYGFDRAMREIAKCEYRIGYEEDLIHNCKTSEGWEIYVNTNVRHQKNMCLDGNSEIDQGIAIKPIIPTEGNSLEFHYVGAFLYMLAITSGCNYDFGSIDDPNFWRLIIGKCSIMDERNTKNENYLRQMNEHFISVEEYSDSVTIDKLKNMGIEISNTYELFNYLINSYSNIIRTYNPAELINKELSSKEYLLEDVVVQANNLKYKLRNKAVISGGTINPEMDKEFRKYISDATVRNNGAEIEQTGTDNPFADYGLKIIRQSKEDVSKKKGGKKDKPQPGDPSVLIDPSQTQVVSYQYASKPSPEGNEMLSPRVYLRNGKYVQIHKSEKENYEATKQRLMTGKN